ncbi:putative MYND finger family protein [Blattamonas nauphoetae]|uniref:MYND finger family protein n=1 Tax=Blattamonas nauphoetae TaxID=2049346 RepID=A0ABQ9Y4W5_9EUKA|nr:putative MYND finger family protein [Blattamonas nauphoetae]
MHNHTKRVNGVDYIIVNTLANPRKQKNECEMCGKIGLLQCPTCRVTYYCCPDHALIDHLGIHQNICLLLKEIRTPSTAMGSERDRLKREHQKEKIVLTIIETSKREAMIHLVSNQFEQAMAAALQAQRNSIQLFGSDRVELVPAYLLLAEASMGLESYEQAESYLAKARYNVLEHPDCQNSLRSRLHRAWGRLMLVTGRIDEAREELAEDVYYSSLDHGPEHIDTTAGYFHLANSFRLTNQDIIAATIYDKVINIWHAFLAESLRRILEKSQQRAMRKGEKTKDGNHPEHKEESDEFDELLEDTQVTEVIGTITRIYQFRQATTGDNSVETTRALHCLGLLNIYAGNGEDAATQLSVTMENYIQLKGEDSEEVNRVRKEMESYL